MESSTIWAGIFLVSSTLLSAGFLSLVLWMLLRESRKKSDADREVALAQNATLDKAIALLSTKDPLAFQAVQAMGWPSQYDDFNPSMEAEQVRIHDRDGERGSVEEDMNAEERAALGDLFPGISPY
jgi:hypothetical protein